MSATPHDSRFMSFPYLQQTEGQTTRAFSEQFASFEAVTADIIDTLFRLPYFIKPRVDEPADGVHQFVLERCYHFRIASAPCGCWHDGGSIQRPPC